jgi:hypothetical protein
MISFPFEVRVAMYCAAANRIEWLCNSKDGYLRKDDPAGASRLRKPDRPAGRSLAPQPIAERRVRADRVASCRQRSMMIWASRRL